MDKSNSWICDTHQDPETGDTIVQLPIDMLFFLDWREGDRLDFDTKNGEITVRNIDSEHREKLRNIQK